MGLSKENADDVKKLINTLAMSQAGTIGATGVAKPEAQQAIIRAKEDAYWLAANRYKYENEMQEVEALNKYLSDRFTGKGYEYKDANGVTQTGYDASPYLLRINLIPLNHKLSLKEKQMMQSSCF